MVCLFSGESSAPCQTLIAPRCRRCCAYAAALSLTRTCWVSRCQASHPHLVAQPAPCAPPVVIDDGPVGPVGDKDEDESSSSSLSADEEGGYEQDPGLAALLKVFGTKESFQCAKLFVRNKFSVARTNKELAGKFLPATFDSCSQMYRMPR